MITNKYLQRIKLRHKITNKELIFHKPNHTKINQTIECFNLVNHTFLIFKSSLQFRLKVPLGIK